MVGWGDGFSFLFFCLFLEGGWGIENNAIVCCIDINVLVFLFYISFFFVAAAAACIIKIEKKEEDRYVSSISPS
jgi:hypothetical protein